ncbi:MAG: putative bicarbonate transporter, IctB family [Bacteroidetes bacterium]|nr:putative bicarbonate transporter, IctB family [Bacteroidota bacterium]
MISSSGSDGMVSGPAAGPVIEAGGGAPGGRPPIRVALAAVTLLFLASSYFSIAVNSTALALMFLLWAWAALGDPALRPSRTMLDYAFLAYVTAELLAGAFSLDPALSFINARRVLLIGIVYALASTLQDVRDRKRAVAVLLGAAGFVGTIGVVKVVLGMIDTNQRLGVFQFYMTTAGVMMIAALLLMPFVVHPSTPRRARIAAAVALVPVLLSLYATVTRGAYLAVVAGAIAIAVIRNRKLLIPLAAIVALTVMFAPPFVENRIRSIVDLQHPENSSRLMVWTASARIIAEYPVLGVGDIDLGALFRTYAPPGYPDLWGHAHNNALQFLATLGIVGTAAVLWMFVRMWVAAWRVHRAVRDEWFEGSVGLGALAVFVGVQVHGLTEWSFGDQEIAVLLWISLGLTMAVARSRGITDVVRRRP